MKRTVHSLILEFRSEIHDRIPALRASVEGKRANLANLLPASEQRNHSALWWILSAHAGTLDKLGLFLRREGSYESLELLAIARNIFENLVWLKLMSSNEQFGIVFYAQFLRNQMESGQALVQKTEDEAALFEHFDSLDSDILEKLGPMSGALSDEDIRRAFDAQEMQSDALDKLIRREFCLYAGQATQNGYGYQAWLIREKAIPSHQAKLLELESLQQRLSGVLATLLDARHVGLATGRWNWSERARDVRMDAQYRFLYSFTSKLLHAIPLNIITDKELSDLESTMILDYIVISAVDLLEIIEEYSPCWGDAH
ncbi:hypothetical protein [Bradyrhizobium guangdongense]|uniref:hypothetical protein n=1 Tax=Bradyrhizobium guangdongense TaxID=1325090 RepID=UPI001319CC08|nr:hypothetical protein [Bradyrhizobium guangdongense]